LLKNKELDIVTQKSRKSQKVLATQKSQKETKGCVKDILFPSIQGGARGGSVGGSLRGCCWGFINFLGEKCNFSLKIFVGYKKMLIFAPKFAIKRVQKTVYCHFAEREQIRAESAIFAHSAHFRPVHAWAGVLKNIDGTRPRAVVSPVSKGRFRTLLVC